MNNLRQGRVEQKVSVIKKCLGVWLGHPLPRIVLFLFLSEEILELLRVFVHETMTALKLHTSFLAREIRYEVLFCLATWISVLVVKRFGEWPSIRDYFPRTRQFWWLFIGFWLTVGLMLSIAWITTNTAGKSYWRGIPHFPYAYILIEFFLTAFVEEIIYRGYVFSFLQKNYGTTPALAGSCITFGGIHLLNGGSYDLMACLMITITSGLLLTGAFAWTKSLYLPIGLHFGYDFAFGLLYGGHHFSPLVSIAPASTTSLFVWLIELYTGAGLLFLVYRRGDWKFSSKNSKIPAAD